MFGFLKKRPPTASTLEQLAASACDDVKAKWIYYNESIQLKADVPLSKKIDLFAQPIQEFFQSKYPSLLKGPAELFWLTTFTAILESGTHPKEEINTAISQLKKKYSPEQNQEQFPNALKSFATEAQACANEMLNNSSYIEKELHRVTMTDELRVVTKTMCASLTATGQAAIDELASWIGNSYKPQELAKRSNGIVNLLSRDLCDLHGLVMALQAQSDIDQRSSLASMLVGESATNVFQAYTRAADAAKTLSDAAARA